MTCSLWNALDSETLPFGDVSKFHEAAYICLFCVTQCRVGNIIRNMQPISLSPFFKESVTFHQSLYCICLIECTELHYVTWIDIHKRMHIWNVTVQCWQLQLQHPDSYTLRNYFYNDVDPLHPMSFWHIPHIPRSFLEVDHTSQVKMLQKRWPPPLGWKILLTLTDTSKEYVAVSIDICP